MLSLTNQIETKMPNGKKAMKGIAWSAIERFAVQGVQFIVSLILARILTPEDFGLVAIVIVFLQILQTINESGFNTALIYKLDRDDLDFSTAFVSNIIFGFVSASALFLLAPVIARFYDNESLIIVMRFLSLNLIINSFGLVPLAKFTINVDFKTLARASFSASIISGCIGIILAIIFRNVYALVFQSISYALFNVLLMSYFAKWVPSFSFSCTRFRMLFYYAYKLIIARVINVVFEDIYSLAIGKLYTPAVLGCYNRAMSFRQVLSKNIINIIQRVSIPLLCSEQNNYDRMKQILLKFIQNSALIVFPLLAGLMVLSRPLVLVLLGEKWIFVSSLLLLGCPCGFFYLMSTFNRNIFNATGRTDLALKSEIAKKIIFVLIFLFTMKFDITILLVGLIIISAIEMVIDMSLSKHQIGIHFCEQFKAISGVIFATAIMSGVTYITIYPILNNIVKLSIGFIIGLVSYIGTIYIFNIANARSYIIYHVKNHR